MAFLNNCPALYTVTLLVPAGNLGCVSESDFLGAGKARRPLRIGRRKQSRRILSCALSGPKCLRCSALLGKSMLFNCFRSYRQCSVLDVVRSEMYMHTRKTACMHACIAKRRIYGV